MVTAPTIKILACGNFANPNSRSCPHPVALTTNPSPSAREKGERGLLPPRPRAGEGSGVRATRYTSANTSATRINNTPSPIKMNAIVLLLVVDGALLKIGVAGNAFGWLPIGVEPYDWG